MLPVAVNTRLRHLAEVELGVVGSMTIHVERGDGVEHLYLLYVISCQAVFLEEIFSLLAVKTFGQQPCRVAHPEKRLSVFVHYVTVVLRHHEPSVAPRLVDFACRIYCQSAEQQGCDK